MTQPKEQREPRRIPDFANREEMAAFWDTHDASDYWDELKPVQVHVAKPLKESLSVGLDSQALAKLRKRAKEQGVGPTTLARTWILAQLGEDEASQKKAGV